MIRGIWQIGKGLLEDIDDPESLFVEYLTEPPRRRWSEKSHLLILKIKTDTESLEFEPLELNEGRLKEYLWVGNAGAANDDQDRVTTDRLEYLISQTIPNLLKKGRLSEGEMCGLLRQAFEKVYLDLGQKEEVFGKSGGAQQYERYRYLMDLRRLGVNSAPSREQLIDFAKEKSTPKAAIKELQNSLTEWIAGKTGLNPKDDIALYTLEIDGILIVKHPEYRKYLFHRIVGEIFGKVHQGKCHLCGEEKPITDNTKFFNLLKFYNTDKLGFAEGFNEKDGFYRRYALCQDCYMAVLAGDAFVRGSLNSNLAYNDVYVIPSFYLDVKLSPERLRGWAVYLQSYLGKLTTLEGWHKFQEELENFKAYEEQKAVFLLNFLFAQKRQAEMRIQKLVQDVSPSRLDLLVEKRNELKEIADRLLGEDRSWDLNLETIFWLFPVRKRQREIYNTDVLNFYEALFVGKPVNCSLLVANFLEVAKMYYYENFGSYVHAPPGNLDRALVQFLLQSAFLVKYLRMLKMLKQNQQGAYQTKVKTIK